MMTPLNRSVARVAKPGERLFLVSDNSSPIVDGTYTATKGRAKRAIKPAKVQFMNCVSNLMNRCSMLAVNITDTTERRFPRLCECQFNVTFILA